MGAQIHAGAADVVIARLAAGQHGVVAYRQMTTAGLSPKQVENRVRQRRLIRLHRGVYAVGHSALRREGWWLAAVLACGSGAVLAARSAAALWGLRPTSRQRVEVIAPFARRIPGIEANRAALESDEHTVEDGIPVTTSMRTLIDLAAHVDETALAKAVNEAEVRRVFDGRELARLLKRHPRARGARRLRAVLADLDSGASATESALELRFLPFLDAHGLPRPLVNATIRLPGFAPRVDCHWPAARLVVELDGRATHHTRAAFESDRTRDRRLTAAGWRVIRVTWRELDARPGEVAAHLETLLLDDSPEGPRGAPIAGSG